MRLPDPLQLPFSTLHMTRPGFTSIGRSWQLDIALDEARPLKFFGLIALYDGPNENASINDELALRITDTIQYHKQLLEGSRVSVTIEDFFEQCLQKINAEINLFLRNYAKPLPVHAWAMLIGMISLDDNPKRLQFSVSRFGEIGGWLLHSAQLDTKKLISIFDSPDSLSPQTAPHKFFRNVLTSSLSKNDQLFFCTPNILNYISLSDLKKILSMLSVNAAMKQLENQMAFSGNDSVVCALTMRLSPYPILERATDNRVVPSGSAQRSIDTLITTESETQKLLSTTFGLNIKRFFLYLFRQISALTGRVLPGATKTLSGLIKRNRTADLGNNAGKRTSIIKPASPLKKMDLLSTNQTVTRVPVWKERLMTVAIPLKKLGGRIGQGFGAFARSGLWKQPRFYITFLLVAGSLSGFIYWRVTVSRYNALVAQAQTQIATVQTNVDQIDGWLVTGREDDASALLAQTRELLGQVQDLDEVRDKRGELENAMTAQQKRLRKEISVEPTIIANNLADQLGSQPQAAMRYGTDYLIFGANPRSYLIQSTDTGTTRIQTLQTEMTAWSTMVANGDSAIFLSENKIVTLDLKKGTVSSAVANTTDSLIGGAIYNDRLYTVAPTQKQILRSNRGPSYSVLANWLKEPVDVSKTRAMTVDGLIYLLEPNSIFTFNQGLYARTGGIQLDAIDPPLEDAKAFALPEGSKYTYILEPKRLVVYNRSNGKLLAQYPAKNNQTYVNMFVDEAEKKAYVLTTNQLISLHLDL